MLSSKIDFFGHFWNCKKWNWVEKILWNWFIWFQEFFVLDFFQFSGLLCVIISIHFVKNNELQKFPILFWRKNLLFEFTAGQKIKKKSRSKNSWSQINQKIFYVKLHFWQFETFSQSKNWFWPFLKLQKMEFGPKKIREIDLFDFKSFFFGLDFFNFLAHCAQLAKIWNKLI